MSTFWVAKNRIGSFMCFKIHNKIHDIKTLGYFSINDYLQLYSINGRLKDISTPTFQPQTFQPWNFHPHGSKIHSRKVRGWKVHGWKVWGWKVRGWSLGLKSPGLRCPSTQFPGIDVLTGFIQENWSNFVKTFMKAIQLNKNIADCLLYFCN